MCAEASTLGYMPVVMLAYRLMRALRRAWAPFDLTVVEGLKHLAALSAMEIHVPGRSVCQKIPRHGRNRSNSSWRGISPCWRFCRVETSRQSREKNCRISAKPNKMY